MTFTISRIGCSNAAAGGIEPCRPMLGSPLIYGASGSVMPYGCTYFIARSSLRCALHRPAERERGEIHHDIGVRWLPAIEQALHFIRKRNAQMRIDTSLPARCAKPGQARRADIDGPIETHLGWADVPAKIADRLVIRIKLARVTNAADATHERRELSYLGNLVTNKLHQIFEIGARLAAEPRHVEHQHALTLSDG